MNNIYNVKVFIADDHPVVIHGVSAILSKRPEIAVVGFANSGEEMFRSLPQARPTILLLDLNMPGSDYFENIAWVKKYAPWVRILAYSGYQTPDLVKSLFAEGIKGFLPKSARPEEIIAAIRSVSVGEIYQGHLAHAQSDFQPATEHACLNDDFRKRLGLSKREQEVLVLISKGLSSQRIGKTLYISKHTVETHRKNMLRKLEFNSSTELVKFAVQHGLV
jgi:DNA-binding NarL/FixJ family response regulator